MAESIPAGPDARDSLAKIVDAEGAHDDAENGYYEVAADPQFVMLERSRRRFRGSYLRRLRRLQARNEHDR